MATVAEVSTGGWEARWRTPAGGYRRKRFTRKRDAVAFCATVETSKLRGVYVDPAAGRVTFAAAAERWCTVAGVGWRPTTAATMRSHLDAHLLPAFGPRPLRSITAPELRSWYAALARSRAPSTARAVLRTMASVLALAVDEGAIAVNPAVWRHTGRGAVKVDPAAVARLAAAVPAVTAAMPARWAAAVPLMATIGLRPGEALGLTVDRVDFLRRRLTVDRQALTVAGGTRFAPPKSASGSRSIPLPARTVSLLAAHVREHGVGEHGLLFTADAGTLVHRGRWAETWRRAATAAGLERTVQSRQLRHVAASALIAAGLSVEAVRAVLGHKNATVTLAVYTHFWPTDEELTRRAIERAAATWDEAAVAAGWQPGGTSTA